MDCLKNTIYKNTIYNRGARDMTNSVTMKDRNRLSEQIVDLALGIISLLIGKEYAIVEKPSEPSTNPGRPCESEGSCRAQIPGTDPPPKYLIYEKQNEQKILELTNKIIQLLTGEVPMRCEDVTVHFSTEEWEYVEGHTDLYTDVVMEKQQTLDTPGGCAERSHAVACKPDSNEDKKDIASDDGPKN
ncbi:gastrula zinc finger protein XlCGF66.1-like, partial [Spea bombifrons]|uniref:gastrula zinc finger protein XlCGF66.1-like n=1 Tax=Spea bombifrons TaxID=233779 RepID=UPI00234AC1FC